VLARLAGVAHARVGWAGAGAGPRTLALAVPDQGEAADWLRRLLDGRAGSWSAALSVWLGADRNEVLPAEGAPVLAWQRGREG